MLSIQQMTEGCIEDNEGLKQDVLNPHINLKSVANEVFKKIKQYDNNMKLDAVYMSCIRYRERKNGR